MIFPWLLPVAFLRLCWVIKTLIQLLWGYYELGSYLWLEQLFYLNMELRIKPSCIIRKNFRVHLGFFWDLQWRGTLLTPLKHKVFSASPFNNMGSFSPTPLPAARPVKRTLLNFPPAHRSPLDERILLEAVGKINQTYQRCKYLSIHTLRGSWANGSALSLLSFPLSTTFPRQKQFEKKRVYFSTDLANLLKP